MGRVGGELRAGAWARGRRLKGQGGKSRGQSLVEFALVLPLFLLLVFAVVEYSLINSAIGAYNFAAKDAARYGAIKGPTSATVDRDMLNIIDSHVTGVVAAVPLEVDIFEATESGTYPGTGKQDVYTFKSGAWVAGATQTWPYNTPRDDRLVSQDYLGVHIKYHYTYVTAFFTSAGATITLFADSVQRIEPQELRHDPTPGTSPAIVSRAPSGPTSPLGNGLSLLAIAPALLYRPRAGRGAWLMGATGAPGIIGSFGTAGKERRP